MKKLLSSSQSAGPESGQLDSLAGLGLLVDAPGRCGSLDNEFSMPVGAPDRELFQSEVTKTSQRTIKE